MDIEVKEYKEPGYAPVIDFESWRVAVLNDIDELKIPNLKTMQKHLESDEVFGSAFFLFAQECAILGDK